MAHALRYWGEQLGDTGLTIRVDIHERDFAGAAEERRLMEDGYHLMPEGPGSRDVYVPVLTATCQAFLWDDGTLDDAIASAADARQFKLIVKEGPGPGTMPVIFEGFIIPAPDTRSLSYPDSPDVTEVLARCGLADLKGKAFINDDGTKISEPLPALEVIIRALKLTGLSLDLYTGCDIFVPEVEEDENPLAKYLIPGEAFSTDEGYPVDAEEVLVEALKPLHLQLRQSIGAWHAVQRGLLQAEGPYLGFDGTFLRFHYQADGTEASAAAFFDPAVVVDPSDADDLRVVTPRQPQLLAYKAAVVTHEHGEAPYLWRNETFGFGSPVRRRSTGTRGRGRDGRPIGRTFVGQFDDEVFTDEAAAHWNYWNDTTEEEESIVARLSTFSPGESNSVGLDAVAPAVITPGGYPDAEFANVDNDYLHQDDGHIFTSDGTHILEVQVSAFPRGVQTPSVIDLTGERIPSYYEVILHHIESGDTRWAERDGTFHASRKTVRYGYGRGTWGAPGDIWSTDVWRTGPVPAGTWQARTKIYPSIDSVYRRTGTSVYQSVEKVYWARPRLQLLRADLSAPEAYVAAAVNSASESTLMLEMAVRHGEAPVADMWSSFTLESGMPATNWQRGYAGLPGVPSGKRLADVLAEELFLEQAENLRVLDAKHLRAMPRCWPHQVYSIGGVRYQVGSVLYSGARATQEGTYPPLLRSSIVPALSNKQERAVTTGDPGGAASVLGGGAAASRDELAASLDYALRLTTLSAEIPAGAQTSATIAVYGGQFIRLFDNDTVIVVAKDSGQKYVLTVNDATHIGPAETGLTFDSYTFPQVVPEGSSVYLAGRQLMENTWRGGGSVDQGPVNIGGPASPETVAGRVRMKKAVNLGDPAVPATNDGDVAVARDASVERDAKVGRALQLVGVSAPGGTAAMVTVYADTAGALWVYVGTAGPYKLLGTDGKVPASILPAIAITDVFVVGSEAAQLALTAEEGDVAVRTDLSKSFIHNGGTSGTASDWQELLTPTDAVLSVNGETGAVVLDYSDVGAAASAHTHAQSDISGLPGALDARPQATHADVSAGSVPASEPDTLVLTLSNGGTFEFAGKYTAP